MMEMEEDQDMNTKQRMDCSKLLSFLSKHDISSSSSSIEYDPDEDDDDDEDYYRQEGEGSSHPYDQSSTLFPTIQFAHLPMSYIDAIGLNDDNDDESLEDLFDESFYDSHDGQEPKHTSRNFHSPTIYLAVARSRRICCCQILGWTDPKEASASSSMQTDPIIIWKAANANANANANSESIGMDYDQEDLDRSIEIISNPNNDYYDGSSHYLDNNDNDDDENNGKIPEYITCSEIITFPPTDSVSLGSSTSSLLEIQQSFSSSVIKACVVLGTNKSRVLAIELNIHGYGQDIAEMSVTAAESIYEPLPFIFPKITRVSSKTDLSQLINHNKDKELSGSSHSNKSGKDKEEKTYKFHPKGGVSSIYSFRRIDSSSPLVHATTSVWVSYVDGTAVQLADCDFFSSLVSYDDEKVSNHHSHLRTRVHIPIPQSARSLPLPLAHSSILAPLPPINNAYHLRKTTNIPQPVLQAISFGGESRYNNAHNPAKGGASLSFYTSEDHCSQDPSQKGSESELYGIIGGYVLDGTKAIVSSVASVTTSVLGTAFGWAWGSSNAKNDDLDSNSNTSDITRTHPNETFLSKVAPNHISPRTTMFDPPRRIQSISVDPSGKYVAVGDSLGRVLLLDLASKQIVRMWKGLRESNCFWIQQYHSLPDDERKQQIVLYLVVHARQRRVVEVWRMKHGGRVKVFSVGEHAKILQCWEKHTNEHSKDVLAKCFVLNSVTTKEDNASNIVEPLIIGDESLSPSSKDASSVQQQQQQQQQQQHNTSILNTSFSSESNSFKHVNSPINLKILQQMLSSDTNVPSNPQKLFAVLTQITSLTDLSQALDLLAVAKHIEIEMGVQGSSFHAKVVHYCQTFLHDMENEEGNEGILQENEHAIQLGKKIEYHSLVVRTYDILSRYETGIQMDEGREDDDDNDSLAPRTNWSVEAIKWVETYDTIFDCHQYDENDENFGGGKFDIIRFSTFSKACKVAKMENDDVVKVNLCDSTKDRKAALLHVFHPFLQDIFVYNVVNSIFDSMRISDDLEKLLQYFGEWFLTLPAKESAKASLFGTWCPILRWLQETVVKSIDVMSSQSTEMSKVIFLEPLLQICMATENLPKAFLLAAVSREAILLATRQQEAKTYGKISSDEAVKPWDELLRKLRVCLLFFLRLREVNTGQFPINPANIEDGNSFSIYEWLAQDEIMISHKQDEIVSIELSCRASEESLHPFDPENDCASKWKLLQSGCMNKRDLGDLRSPKKPSMNEKKDCPPLLLYFKSHIHPVKLAAHRALILSGKWGQKPGSLHLLKDAVNALRALDHNQDGQVSLVIAIRVEIWQTYIRPVFRALLFGFEDVHELSEDVWTPLCMDGNWLRGFTKVAGEILALIAHAYKNIQDMEESDAVTIHPEEADELGDRMWPPIQKDIILENIIAKSRKIHLNALKEHQSIVGAVHLVPDDLSKIDSCIPEYSSLFLQNSLFCETQYPTGCDENKTEFVLSVLVNKAQTFSGPFVDYLKLGELELLSNAWGIPLKEIRSRYLLALYTAGKDSGITDLTASSFQHIHLQIFIDGAFDIVCKRLNSTIGTLKKNKQLRKLIGVLDADTCEWIRNRAESAGSDDSQNKPNTNLELPSLSATHELALKVLQMCSSVGVSSSIKQAHSLSVLTGTLMKEMEDLEQNI